MDNRPEEDVPMYIPALRSYEVVQYPASRRRPSFIVLFFVIFSALLAFWLATHWIRSYDQRQAFHRLEKRDPGLLSLRKIIAMDRAMVGPYHLPLSKQYRLAGKIQGEYVATSGPGWYVLIPAKDCQLVNGGPYCEYHGATVTQSSGSQ